jgi:hypothetical protein
LQLGLVRADERTEGLPVAVARVAEQVLAHPCPFVAHTGIDAVEVPNWS